MKHMTTVGIRELKQNASAVMAQVKAGEVVIVTERGKPVGKISPIRQSRWEEMIESGELIPAKGNLADLPPRPVMETKDGRTLLETLLEMREEESY